MFLHTDMKINNKVDQIELLFLFLRLPLKIVSEKMLFNVIYKCFISQICLVLPIIYTLFEKLHKNHRSCKAFF